MTPWAGIAEEFVLLCTIVFFAEIYFSELVPVQSPGPGNIKMKASLGPNGFLLLCYLAALLC